MTRLQTLERRYERAIKQCRRLPPFNPMNPDSFNRSIAPCEKVATRTYHELYALDPERIFAVQIRLGVCSTPIH